MNDGGGKGDLLPGADRKGFDRAIAFLSGIAPVQNLMGTAEGLGGWQAGEPGCVSHHLDPGKARHRALIFRHHTDCFADPSRVAVGIVAKDPGLATGQPHQTEDCPHERALASPIGADQTGDAGGDLKRHSVEHRPSAVAFDDVGKPHRNWISRCGHGKYSNAVGRPALSWQATRRQVYRGPGRSRSRLPESLSVSTERFFSG